MHHKQPSDSFLFRYESIFGLWVQTKLDFQASRPLLEAMNAILLKDGILGFTGTKSEFGQYLTKLKGLKEADSTGSWTSLPEATILATLGLCLNPSTAGGRSLVFYGSPRVRLLAYVIDLFMNGPYEVLDQWIEEYVTGKKPFVLSEDMQRILGFVHARYHNAHEVADAYSDYVSFIDHLGHVEDSVDDYIHSDNDS
jgi:hypothetical protein